MLISTLLNEAELATDKEPKHKPNMTITINKFKFLRIETSLLTEIKSFFGSYKPRCKKPF